MSKPPWSITSIKREAISRSTSHAVPKRQRLSDGESTSSIARRKNQRTLTQAQWVTAVRPSYDEAEMQLLDDERQQRAPPKRKPRQSVKKRNSTLTQMDFFDFQPRDDQDFDDTMIEQADGSAANRAFPQVDGTYESPRKPRKRKITLGLAGSTTKRKSAAPVVESQEEYKPSMRKRKIEASEDGPSDSVKRKSRRLASKNEILSDPVRNFDYFAEALGTPSVGGSNDATEEAFNYPLETKDSTEDYEQTVPEGRPTSRSSLLPQTPKRNTTIVLSSQSPESLRASTRRMYKRLYETPPKSQRTPLAERSVNDSVDTTPNKTSRKRPRSPKRHSPKGKVVVLKLPKRNQDRRPARIEDSQANLWSVPSSSAETTRKPPEAQVLPTVSMAQNDIEIPATSQAQQCLSSPAGSQDSLPSLSDLFPARKNGEARARDATNADALRSSSQVAGIIVRDFADVPRRHSAQGSIHDKHPKSPFPPGLLARERASASEKTTKVDDEDVEFGSPIANDTQFNIQVQHRVSSPLPSEQSLKVPGAPLDHQRPSTPTLRTVRPAHAKEPSSDLPDIERVQSSQSPIPIPKLGVRSSIAPEGEFMEVDDHDTDEVPLPMPVFVRPASIRRTSTQVPLNDTSHGSSSPPLHPARGATQKSVHPASMPHPSQMSTQEPTQAFLLPSSLPQNGRDELGEKPEKITIKDSSSLGLPMSQIPRHVGTSQAQLGPNVDSEDEDDLDLDPPSLPPQSSQPCRRRATPCQPPEEHPPSTLNSEVSDTTPRPNPSNPPTKPQPSDLNKNSSPVQSSQLSLPSSPDHPPPLKKQYAPIPGFNNETQSNFTQNGHVTAAFIHRQREAGLYPTWFVPTPYQVPGYTRRG